MPLDKLIVLIILMGLGSLRGSQDHFPARKPSGKWFVVAADGYNMTLPKPKCWTIVTSNISDADEIGGVSTFYDNNTSERYQFHFTGKRYAGFQDSRVSMHHFNIYVKYGTNKTLVISTISHIHLRKDRMATLSDMSIVDHKWDYFNLLYLSRHPEIPKDNFVGDALRIDHSNCSDNALNIRPGQAQLG